MAVIEASGAHLIAYWPSAAGASSAAAAAAAGRAAALSEADWQRDEIAALRKEAANIRDRNAGLMSQIEISKGELSVNASALSALSWVSTTATGTDSVEKCFEQDRRENAEFIELRARVWDLEKRRRRLEMERIEALASLDSSAIPTAGCASSTTIPMRASSMSGPPMCSDVDRDRLLERLSYANDARMKAEAQADRLESRLASARAARTATLFNGDLQSDLRRETQEQDEPSPELSRQLGELRECRRAYRNRYEAHCARLEKAEAGVHRWKRSCQTLLADRDAVQETRNELMIEMADVTVRLETISRSHVAAVATETEISEHISKLSRTWEVESEQAAAIARTTEAETTKLEASRQKVDVDRDQQAIVIAELQAELDTVRVACQALRSDLGSGAAARLQRLNELVAARNDAEIKATEARSMLVRALGDLQEKKASGAASLEELRKTTESAKKERLSFTATESAAAQFRALVREMNSRAQMIDGHVLQERRRGDALRAEIVAAEEAAQRLKRSTSADSSRCSRRSASVPTARRGSNHSCSVGNVVAQHVTSVPTASARPHIPHASAGGVGGGAAATPPPRGSRSAIAMQASGHTPNPTTPPSRGSRGVSGVGGWRRPPPQAQCPWRG
eukprot:TRINITY_DN54851_c0_g1_i1.p1 TRINITY_DN54851_c0_g1~~TRINITY_DN54851_c0_g1_i1.p1  ORF type:complete len:627 (+),score=103.25 TRINITY_DN54851_c0_g1_i1:129-2009(+)